MGDLTKNFSKSEFVCKHCGELILDPLLPPALQMLRDAANKLYPQYGEVKVKVHCGYRCEAHNAAIGGEKGSQHTKGKAADVTMYSGSGAALSAKEMYLAAMKVPVFVMGGVGVYPQKKFMHVDVRGTAARWGSVKGRYTSAAEALNFAIANRL